jgi:hypothetical protein
LKCVVERSKGKNIGREEWRQEAPRRALLERGAIRYDPWKISQDKPAMHAVLYRMRPLSLPPRAGEPPYDESLVLGAAVCDIDD